MDLNNFEKLADIIARQTMPSYKGCSPVEQLRDLKLCFVPKISVEGSEPLRCWYNCRDYTSKHGGSTIFGWALFSGDTMYQAQHHAVWCNQEGEFFDITPDSGSGQSDTVFLPDGRVPFDFERRVHPVSMYSDLEGKHVWGGPNLVDKNGKYITSNFCVLVQRQPDC